MLGSKGGGVVLRSQGMWKKGPGLPLASSVGLG